MAELKRTFVKGGMNLDLDERLVGQGYYREAFNIRVSSSSEGNEGSLETVRANSEIFALDGSFLQPGTFGPYPPFVNNITRSSIVGTTVDRSTDLAYHLVTNSARTNYPFADNTPQSPNYNEETDYTGFVENTIKADSIYEYDARTQSYDLVFNDIYEIQSEVQAVEVDENNQTYLILPTLQDLDIREDMRVFQMDSIIGFIQQETVAAPANENLGEIYVDRVDRVNNRVFLKDLNGSFNANILAPLNYVRFRSKRILNFNHQQQKGYITGVNVFDGLIFFTDGNNEPKKINIRRSKDGTVSNSVAVYPNWISDRRYFHTRLIMPNPDNAAGFQNIPYYDFFGNINTGTGGVIESNCTVIRPNPEEHLKVLSDVGVIQTEQNVVGPKVGVMAHPFPIHPIWSSGKQLQFAVAFANEGGFFEHQVGGNVNDVLGVDVPMISFNTAELNNSYEEIYGDFFLVGDPALPGNNAGLISRKLSCTLSVPDAFAYSSWLFTSSLQELNAYSVYVGAGDQGNSNVFMPSPGSLYTQFGGGFHPSNGYALLGENEGPDNVLNFRILATEHSNFAFPNNDYIPGSNLGLGLGALTVPGAIPSAFLDDVSTQTFDPDSINEDGSTMLDLYNNYYGTSGTRILPGTNDPRDYELLEYFDATNPVMSINAAVAGSVVSSGSHPIRKAFHRGGLLSQVNAIASEQGFNVMSNYWGITQAEADKYIHNGWFDFNENNLLRPTGPGRFVVPPHGFNVGDIIILEGKGNTVISSQSVGQYSDKNLAGENYIVEKNTIHEAGQTSHFKSNGLDFNIEPVVLESGDQGGQVFTNESVLYNNPYDEVQSRRHDGYGDKVRARIVKIEQVNIRDNDVVISTVDENGQRSQTIQDSWIDCNGVAYNDLTEKFIFLNEKLVGKPILDGSDVNGENGLPPSFFSTKSLGSQYIFTIEIIDNNLKKSHETSLRADLSNKHIDIQNAVDGGGLQPVGFGDVTKNAAMMERNHLAKKSPYFDLNQGFGFVEGSIPNAPKTYGANNLPMYYGPPLPQVWSISLASLVADSEVSDEKAFKDQMLRFSYRYQYIDNEYSGLAPFTTVVWRTLNQSIDWPNYYISLINEIKNLDLLDWRPKNLPKDVKAIELFMKSEEANNIYSIKKYDFRDNEYLLPANGSYSGVHNFKAETLGLTLDPNQLLRPFDSVPRTALAQEVVANRVIYGNYLKDYNLQEVDINSENPIDIKVNLSVELFNYINQTQTDILDADGNSIVVGIIPEDNVIDAFQDSYANQINANFGVPLESIKSYRSYQVGIVYRDEYGRETPVLTNKQAILKVTPEQAKKSNRIKVTVKNPHPSWAKSYKFFVKDTSLDYHVASLEEAFHFVKDDNSDLPIATPNDSSEALSVLAFNSNDRNKIQEGDILIQKRAHRIAGPPDPALTNITYGYEPDNDSLEYEVQRIQNEAPQAIIDALTDTERLDGKFFVFVKTDRPLIINNPVGPLPGPNTPKTQGVFETRPKPNYDSDLYFEASQAYPIVMDDETDEQFIKVGRMVEAFVYTPGANFDGTLQSNAIVNPLDTFFPTEYGVDTNGDGGVGILDETAFQPIKVTAVKTLSGRHSQNDDIFTEIVLDQAVTLTAPPAPSTLTLRILEHRGDRHNVGEHVYVTVVGGVVNSNSVIVRRHTHVSNFNLTNNIALPIALPWYNCFTFGNGVEISTARNSFNSARIQKGVKASTTYEDYAEVQESGSLIFSGIYNSYSQFNETNQFIEALGITKRFNPDHGSVQKLFARSNDLLVLCEDKVLKVLADKEAIFKADSEPDLVATNRVLGQSVAFDGEYGISTNPESFAHYGFRSYFADAKRGVVLRLSKDGLTAISYAGMDFYFKTNLSFTRASAGASAENADYIFGSYDVDKNEYLISSEGFRAIPSIEYSETGSTPATDFVEGITVAWDEGLNVWTSFRTYVASAQGYSINNKYFSPFQARHYEHDSLISPYGAYEGIFGSGLNADGTGSMLRLHQPRVAVVYNENPGMVKDFTYVNYEGSQARIISDYSDDVISTEVDKDGWWLDDIVTDLEQGMSINFKNKENKWHNNFNKYVQEKFVQGEQFFNDPVVNGETTISLGSVESVQVSQTYPDGSPSAIIIQFEQVSDLFAYAVAQDDNGSISDLFLAIVEEGPNDTVFFNNYQFMGLLLNIDASNNQALVTLTDPFNPATGNNVVNALQNNFLNNNVFVNPPAQLFAFIQESQSISQGGNIDGVKGYYAKAMWRNNDHKNKSELFATALNAIESSK
tara:strand:+ start:369 stop:7151 length:6783 start_codon:yes stop_codon:yes gene_type:complete